jgi:hypothetical protein
MNFRAGFGQRHFIRFTGAIFGFLLLVFSMQNCSAGGGSSGGSVEWYYHWNCNGDSECLLINSACGSGPSGTCPPSGTADEGSDTTGYYNCDELMQFAANIYGPSAVDSCDNNPLGSPGGGGSSTPAPTISSFSPASGTAGTQITINGANFPTSASLVTVTVNGAVATVGSISSTQIVVTVPALNPSTGQVVVTTSAGAYIAGSSFTVTGTVPPSVFWTEHNPGGAIKALAKSGGVITTLAGGLEYPTNLTEDSSNLYWIEYDSISRTTGALRKMSKSGGTITTLVSNLSYLVNSDQLATDGSYVYWLTVTSLSKVSVNGGTVTTLASGNRFGNALAIDSTYAYYFGDGNLYKVPLAGGSATTLATGVTYSMTGFSIAVDGSNVYWTDNTNFAGSGVLNKVSLSVGTVTTLASNLNTGSLDIDSSKIYLFDYSGGTGYLQSIPKAGGSFTTLATGLSTADSALDGSGIFYWTEFGSNTAGDIGKVSSSGGAVTHYGSNLYEPVGITVDP